MIRFVLRTLGLWILAAGFVFLVYDGTKSIAGDQIYFTKLGDVWNAVNSTSLQLLQPAIERHVAEWLWNPVILSVLTAPAFLVFAVVRVEPAPSDAMFAVIICVAIVTGRMTLRTTPLGPALGVAAFIALNLVSSFAALDPARAAKFMSITIYLLVFALWVPSWVT